MQKLSRVQLVNDASEVGESRRAAMAIASELGFDETALGRGRDRCFRTGLESY